MARSLFEAISAAAAQLQNATSENTCAQGASVKPKVQPKKASAKAQDISSNPPTQNAKKPKAQTDTQKVKGGAKYVIPASFKQAIETYLNSRADMKTKLSANGKSLDGCCDYIFDVMRKKAENNRGGKSAVGMYVEPQEVFGLAVHYYDESEESLKAELKS